MMEGGAQETGEKYNMYILISLSLFQELTMALSEYRKLLSSLDFFQILPQSEQAQNLTRINGPVEMAQQVKGFAADASLMT